MRRLLALFALAFAACAPTMTTLQPPTVPAKGDFGGGLGLATAVPVGPIVDLVESGEAVADEVETAALTGDTSTLTKEDIVRLMEAGGAALLSLPSISPTVLAKYAFLPRWEGGIRLAGSSTAIFVRNQILEAQRHGLNGTWGASFGRATFEFPLGSLEPLEIEDFSRTELEGHFFFGWSDDLGHLWFGPKLVLTSYESGASVTITESCAPFATLDGSAGYASGALGGAIGWKVAWIGLELTAGYMSSSTTLEGDLNCPEIDTDASFSTDVDADGLMVGAELGLVLAF